MSRYKFVSQPPLNRAQRRAAKRGKEYIHAGSAKKERGRVKLKPYSESGLDFDEHVSTERDNGSSDGN